jgi:hypothetical protein
MDVSREDAFVDPIKIIRIRNLESTAYLSRSPAWSHRLFTPALPELILSPTL